jgi:hypothetical protein
VWFTKFGRAALWTAPLSTFPGVGLYRLASMAIDDQRSPSDGGMKKQPSLTMGHGVLQGICYMPNSFESFTSPPIFRDPSERSMDFWDSMHGAGRIDRIDLLIFARWLR